jgi:dienelactone hydrolase
VIVPERRGYGKSGGQTFSEEIGTDKGDRFIARQQAEADDVLAAVVYAKTQPFVDASHIAVMGWSFGGIATVFAASRSDAFAAAVDQAGGSLSWDGSAALRKALPEAASRIRIPMLCLVAENDATTAAVKNTYEAAKSGHAATELKIYPAFTLASNPNSVAPGHAIFGAQGLPIWSDDVLNFLAKYLRN